MKYTAKITVVEDCECPPDRQWWKCDCQGAIHTEYRVLPLNYDGAVDYPCPEALADVMVAHPGAQFVYMDTKVYGRGCHGETLMEAARRVIDGTLKRALPVPELEQ